MEHVLEKLINHIDKEITSDEYVLLREYLKMVNRNKRILIVASLKRVESVECLLEDDKEILECYSLLREFMDINLSKQIYNLLMDLNDQELIIKYLDNITFTYLKRNLVLLIQSDEVKLEYIKNSQVDTDKYMVAKTIECDKYKLLAVEYIQDMNLKTKLICQINDEEVRANMLMILPPFYRMRVCKTITSQKILRELYEKNLDSFFSYEILSLIHDDELKMKMINNYSLNGQVEIIISLDNEENIMKFIMDSQYDSYCDSFVKSLSYENIIKYFNKITNLSYKIRIINIVNDNVLKRKLILLLENEDIKRNLLGNLDNDKKWIIEDTELIDMNYDIDKKMTIGVELEVCCDETEAYLTMGKLLGDWEIKKDRTVIGGFEITSPILHYDENSLRELKYVSEVLKRNNFYTNDSCGGHIHLGFDYFSDVNQFKVFIMLYKSIEDILYLISNRAWSAPRTGIEKYAKYLRPVINNLWVNIDKMNDLSGMVTLIKEKCDSRYYGLNLSNAFDKKHTLEFRMPNGEFDFNELLLNIRLFVKLLEKSKRIVDIFNKNRLLDEDIKELKLYQLIINENIIEEEKLGFLLELLFNNCEIDEYVVRYRENKKQRIKMLEM